MSDTEAFHPLKQVWLRPRHVFRELAREPLGSTDYVLAALQGVCNYLIVYRLQLDNLHPDQVLSLPLLLSNAMLYGAAMGLLATWFYALVYAGLGARLGRPIGRAPVFHVLSYGSVPVVAALLLSVGSALLVGEAVLIPPKDPATLDGFVLLVSHLQLTLVGLLYLWSYLLQVMGFSELAGVPVFRAFVLWLLGQVVGALAALFLRVLLTVLFPSLAGSA